MWDIGGLLTAADWFPLLCFSLNHQEAETRFVPSVQDFDKKLAEADAYLQILIDQLKVGQSFFFSLNTSPFSVVTETYGKVCHLHER